MARATRKQAGPAPSPDAIAPWPRAAARGVMPLRLYLCAVAVLAPLKCGGPIGPGEIALWPASLLEWVVGSWPPFVLGALSGVGLLWAVLVCRNSLRGCWGCQALYVWLGLLASCGPGLVPTTEWDYALTFVLYLAGVCSFLAAALLAAGADPGLRRWLAGAIAAGTLLCALSGWHQRLWGFAEMRRFMEEEARRTGRVWVPAVQGKLLQTRVHEPFFHPNSYAAHLILTGPLTLLVLWRAGRRVHPERVSRWLFVGLGGVLVAGALVLSQSRGAQLALGGGIGLALLGFRPLGRWRWVLTAVALLGGAAAMVAVSAGRDLLSAGARVDYYRAALHMARERPVTGVGLGEFLSAYLEIKPFGAEETRAAHNLILEMLAQTGAAGGVAGACCILLPVWLSLRRREPGDETLHAAAVAGLGAWSLHALLDFDLQIPPTVTLAAAMPLFCRPGGGGARPQGRPAGVLERGLLAGLAVLSVAALWRVPGEDAFRRLSDLLGDAGDEVIEAAAGRASCLLPLSPEPPAMWGREQIARGRPVRAADAFRQALARTPRRSALHAWLAHALLVAGDFAGAETAAREAWGRYPGSPRAMLLHGLALLAQDTAAGSAPERAAWLAAGLSCSTDLQPDGAGVAVALGPAPGAAPGPSLLEALCRRLNELRLQTPGPRPVPVSFRPAPGAAGTASGGVQPAGGGRDGAVTTQ